MELPSDVLIHNQVLGLKGTRGVLLQVSADGYYELNCPFGENTHRVRLPIQSTVLIAAEPEEAITGEDIEVER